MMTGYMPFFVFSGLQPSGIWNSTYIWPITIDWFVPPALELVAYWVVLFTPPMKKLPSSLIARGAVRKAPSLPLPSACAEALVATSARVAAAVRPQPAYRVKRLQCPMELSSRLADVQLINLLQHFVQDLPWSPHLALLLRARNLDLAPNFTPGPAGRMDIGVDLSALNCTDHVVQVLGSDALGGRADYVSGRDGAGDRPFPQRTVLRHGDAGRRGQVGAEENHDAAVHSALAEVDMRLSRVRQQPGVGHGEGHRRPARIHRRGELALPGRQ